MVNKIQEIVDGKSCMKYFLQVQAEKLVIEADDVGPGLVQLIAQHKITNLVMGAAADKNYSRYSLSIPSCPMTS